MAKLLVIDDDPNIVSNLTTALTREQHVVESAMNGTDGLCLLEGFSYDLLILDWQLPDMSGLEVLQATRQRGLNVPVLFLTAMKELKFKEAGFEDGADDYLTKPFEMSELRLRVKALLRRAMGSGTSEIKIGPIAINLSSCEVTVGDKPVHLLPKEYALLEYLARHPKRVFSADDLLTAVWKSETESSANTVRTYMYTLRKKISPKGVKPILQTVYGLGYKLDPDS